MREPRLAGDGPRRRRVVAGDHHDLDPGAERALGRLADAGPKGVREPDQRAQGPRLALEAAGQADDALATSGRRLERGVPGLPILGGRARDIRDDLGRADDQRLGRAVSMRGR